VVYSAVFPVAADEWRTWLNANEWANRHGAFLRDMDQREREAFEDERYHRSPGP
jgi:hypothetical protein